MDIFGKIGSAFGGIFGRKKDDEETRRAENASRIKAAQTAANQNKMGFSNNRVNSNAFARKFDNNSSENSFAPKQNDIFANRNSSQNQNQNQIFAPKTPEINSRNFENSGKFFAQKPQKQNWRENSAPKFDAPAQNKFLPQKAENPTNFSNNSANNSAQNNFAKTENSSENIFRPKTAQNVFAQNQNQNQNLQNQTQTPQKFNFGATLDDLDLGNRAETINRLNSARDNRFLNDAQFAETANKILDDEDFVNYARTGKINPNDLFEKYAAGNYKNSEDYAKYQIRSALDREIDDGNGGKIKYGDAKLAILGNKYSLNDYVKDFNNMSIDEQRDAYKMWSNYQKNLLTEDLGENFNGISRADALRQINEMKSALFANGRAKDGGFLQGAKDIAGGLISGLWDTTGGRIANEISSDDEKFGEMISRINDAYKNGLISYEDLENMRANSPEFQGISNDFVLDKNGFRKANLLENTTGFAGKVLDAGTTIGGFVIPGAAGFNAAQKTLKTAKTLNDAAKLANATQNFNRARNATIGADFANTGIGIGGQALEGELTPESALLQLGMTGLGNVGGVLSNGATNIAAKTAGNIPVLRDIPAVQNRNFANAIENPATVKTSVDFGKLNQQKFTDFNAARAENNLPPVSNGRPQLFPDDATHINEKHIANGNYSPDELTQIARDAIYNKESRIIPDKNPSYQNNVISGNLNNNSVASLGAYRDSPAIKTVFSGEKGSAIRQLKNASDEPSFSSSDAIDANLNPRATDQQQTDFSDFQGVRADIVANQATNVNPRAQTNPKNTEIAQNPATGEITSRTKLADGSTSVETTDASGNLVSRNVEPAENAQQIPAQNSENVADEINANAKNGENEISKQNWNSPARVKSLQTEIDALERQRENLREQFDSLPGEQKVAAQRQLTATLPNKIENLRNELHATTDNLWPRNTAEYANLRENGLSDGDAMNSVVNGITSAWNKIGGGAESAGLRQDLISLYEKQAREAGGNLTRQQIIDRAEQNLREFSAKEIGKYIDQQTGRPKYVLAMMGTKPQDLAPETPQKPKKPGIVKNLKSYNRQVSPNNSVAKLMREWTDDGLRAATKNENLRPIDRAAAAQELAARQNGTRAQIIRAQEDINQIVPNSVQEKIRRGNINIKAPDERLYRGKRSSKSYTEYAAVETVKDGKISNELIPLDGTKHTLRNGQVVDKDGKIVGSYVGIDKKSGEMTSFLGGKPINLAGNENSILGDLGQWGNKNSALVDIDRLIERNAPNIETARRVQNFATNFKDRQEAAMKTDLAKTFKNRATDKKILEKNLPAGVSKKQLSEDIFGALNGDISPEQLINQHLIDGRPVAGHASYGEKYVRENLTPFIASQRQYLDNRLRQTNAVLRENGLDEIGDLKDYIAHIKSDPKFMEQLNNLMSRFSSPISSDVNPGAVRGGIPDEIAGRTANTGARKKWNPFAQHRKGGSDFSRDFWGVMDTYDTYMAHNQYMTPAVSRTRLVERAFRVADQQRQIQVDNLMKDLGLSEKEARDQIIRPNNNKNFKADQQGKFVSALQEYGNQLAGKTNGLDRWFMDNGAGGVVKGSAKLQGITGASTIPGKMSSAVAQTLSLPQTFARDSVKSFIGAVKDIIFADGKKVAGKFSGKDFAKNDPLRLSAFMRDRYTNVKPVKQGIVRNITDKASIPMNLVERFSGELSWRSAYREAKSKGLDGMDAIREADIQTKKTLAGRGAGDRPVAFNSKAAGIITQFGLEVNNMRTQFFRDFNATQKAKFIVAAAAMGYVFENALGLGGQLPNYIDVATDVYGAATDNDDKTNPLQTAFQRTVGETAKFVPGAGTLANLMADDRTKESIFGTDSDISRYGNPAISGLLTSALKDIPSALADKNPDKLIDAGLKFLPVGGQIRATKQGIQQMTSGEMRDSRGNLQTPIDQTNPANWIRAGLFGKSAISEVNNQYNNPDAKSLGKTETATYDNLLKTRGKADAQKFYDETVAEKLAKSKNSMQNPQNNLAQNSTNIADASRKSETELKGAGNWYGITDGKIESAREKSEKAGVIERNDGKSAFGGNYDVSGLTDYQKNKLAMTGDEVQKDIESGKWVNVRDNYDAKLAASAKNGESRKKQEEIRRERDVYATSDEFAKKYNLDAENMNSLMETYKNTNLTEWREMADDDPMKNALFAYGEALAGKKTAYGYAGNNGYENNKYYAKNSARSGGSSRKSSGGKSSGSAKKSIDVANYKSLYTPSLATLNKDYTGGAPDTPTTAKKSGIVKGIKREKMDTKPKITPLKGLSVKA